MRACLTVFLLLLLLAAPPVVAEEEVPRYAPPKGLPDADPERSALVTRLVRSVVEEEPGESEEAWRVLASLGPDAVGPVIEALPHADWLGRTLLMAALSESGVEAVVPILIDGTKDPSWSVREMAAHGLAGERRREVGSVLLPLLADPSWRVRGTAAVALRKATTRGLAERDAAIAGLLPLAADPDRDVRLIALGELGHLQADEARAAFIAGYRSEDEDLRNLCLLALTGLEEARGELVAAMEDALGSSEEEIFLEAATKYVELTGEKILSSDAHRSRLLRLLRSRTGKSAEVFREIGEPAIPCLLDALQSYHQSPGRIPVRGDFSRTVLDLVQEILKEDAAGLLEEVLKDRETADPVRRHAVTLAARYHAKELVDTLKELYGREGFIDIRASLLRGIAAANDPELPSYLRNAILTGSLPLGRAARRLVVERPEIDVNDALATVIEGEERNPEMAASWLRILVMRKSPRALDLAENLLNRPDPEFRRAGAGSVRRHEDGVKVLALLDAAFDREDGRQWDEEEEEDGGDEAEELRSANRRRTIQVILQSARISGGEASLDLLGRAARDGDPVVREKALDEVAEIAGDRAMRLAIETLQSDTDRAVRRAALRAVVEHDSPEVEELLTARLTGEAPEARNEVLRALRRSDTAALPPAVAEGLIRSEWPEDDRLTAVDALAKRSDDAHLPVLSKLLAEDGSEEVRGATVRALAGLTPDTAGPILLSLLPESLTGLLPGTAVTTLAAVETLGEMKYRPAAKRLLQLLDEQWELALTEPTADSAHFAASDVLLTALGRLGDPEAIPPLVSMLFSEQLHRSFSLLEAAPPKDRRSLLGGLVKALVRFSDADLARVGPEQLDRLRESGELFRIDEGYLLYLARLFLDPRREEIRLPRPRRRFAEKLLEAVLLEVVPRESPGDSAALFYLIDLTAGRKDFSEAAKLAKTAADLAAVLSPTAFREYGDYREAHADFLAGIALLVEGKEREGLALFEQGRDRDPQDADILNDCAWWLAESEPHLDLALEAALAAGRRAPSDPSVLDTVGWVLLKMGRHREAARYIYEAVTLDREASERGSGRLPDPLLLYHLAAACCGAGDHVNATEALTSAISMDDTIALSCRSDPLFAPLREADLLEKVIAAGLARIQP